MTSPPTTVSASAAVARDAADLRLAVGRLSRRMRQEAATGLSLTQLGILHTIDRLGPTTLGDLAASERVAPPTITKAVASLVETGLVEKVGCEDDRRVHRARLTASGQGAVREAAERRDAWLATRLATLSPDDRRLVLAVVPLLRALAEDEESPA